MKVVCGVLFLCSILNLSKYGVVNTETSTSTDYNAPKSSKSENVNINTQQTAIIDGTKLYFNPTGANIEKQQTTTISDSSKSNTDQANDFTTKSAEIESNNINYSATTKKVESNTIKNLITNDKSQSNDQTSNYPLNSQLNTEKDESKSKQTTTISYSSKSNTDQANEFTTRSVEIELNNKNYLATIKLPSTTKKVESNTIKNLVTNDKSQSNDQTSNYPLNSQLNKEKDESESKQTTTISYSSKSNTDQANEFTTKSAEIESNNMNYSATIELPSTTKKVESNTIHKSQSNDQTSNYPLNSQLNTEKDESKSSSTDVNYSVISQATLTEKNDNLSSSNATASYPVTLNNRNGFFVDETTTSNSFSTGETASYSSTDETTTSNPLCLDPDPPTLIYNNAYIYWDVYQRDLTCEPIDIHVTCTHYNSSIIIVSIDSSIASNYIDTNNATTGFEEGVKYSCTATLIFKGNIISKESNILSVPLGPYNITINYNEQLLSWNAAFENVSLTYSVEIERLSSNHYIPPRCESDPTTSFNDTTNQTSYLFTDSLADFKYGVSISTEFWKFPVAAYANFSTLDAAPGIPTNIYVQDLNNVTTDGLLSYVLFWSMPCDPNGAISGYDILLTDIETQNIVLNSTVAHLLDADTDELKLPSLTPNTNYNLKLYSIGSTNLISPPAYFNFSTTDGLPGASTVDILDQGATFFVIYWWPPTFTGGKIPTITNYTLNISVIGPNYIQPQTPCPQPNNISLITFGPNDLTYNFTEAWPSYKYTISVIAYSSAGAGPPGLTEITTNSSEPEAPENLSLAVDAILNNNISANLTWDDPCKMNGKIETYKIVISEKYTEDNEDVKPTETQNNTTNKFLLLSLKPSHFYIINVTIELQDGILGTWSSTNYTTQVGFPGRPQIYERSVFDRNFSVSWLRPVEKTGPINEYGITIKYQMPLYEIPLQCTQPTFDTISQILSTNVHEFNVSADVWPYTWYTVALNASTIKGYGDSALINITTKPAEPEPVRNVQMSLENELNEEYNATITISFYASCNLFGRFVSYTLECIATRDGYPWIHNIDNITSENLNGTNSFTFSLLPERNYSCNITTRNHMYWNTINKHFLSPAGVPNFEENMVSNIPINPRTTTEVEITLKKEDFNMTQGSVKYIALILSTKNVTTTPFKRWTNSSPWPGVYEGARQLTPDLWNPFESSDEIHFTIGNGTFENPPLTDDTVYYLKIRIFTSDFFRDSPSIFFKTDKISKLGTIIGILVAFSILALLGVAGFFLWKKRIYRRLPRMYPRKSSTKSLAPSSTAVPLKKFIQYVKNCESKPEILKEQFALLTEKSNEIQTENTSNFAALVENRRKNRYVNISPYDTTRVKLTIEEDDEIGSDYINASYVKGYSGDIEYIATQGPLPSTCRDFWKMVLQENVTIIAMVSNFVENNKQKCHKYFPANHENLLVSENMEIRCATELHFGTYVVRNLQVRKDCTQVTVTHMQFLEWPDFGVPIGTEHMLQFCYQLRERVKIEGGLVIVHCSAGVGRTGTLIAADTLLQNAHAGKQIDIFKTILELRKQRVLMVQTKEQYIYLHRLLADHIDRPPSPDTMEAPDPVYENMDIIKRPTDEYKIREEEEESRF